MGVALAEAALDRGADVTLIAADVSVPLPDDRARIVRVETAAELRAALQETLFERGPTTPIDALVMAAAVADFTPAKATTTKLERSAGLTLELTPTPDLLAEIASNPNRPLLVGFAAETGSLDRAAAKLRRKGVDLLVANDVSEPGSGFGTDTNRVVILDADGGSAPLPLLSKREVAERILDRVATALDARDTAAQTDDMKPSDAVEAGPR